jgi:TRAP-type C4-dicarboxylate transport system substrate-binding protein
MKINSTSLKFSGLIAAGLLAFTACGSGDSNAAGDDDGITLQFATSQGTSHPNYWCGAELFAEQVANDDVGINIDVFPQSQLGADTERIHALISGDLDMDLTGTSGMSSLYSPIGVVDSAYAFDDIHDLYEWLDSEDGQAMLDGIYEELGVKVITGWYYGAMEVNAQSEVRTPEDLAKLQVRFPDSPAYLLNAAAIGANAVPVAFEEIYTSLQQGIVDGTVSPITALESESLDEVVSHVNLTEHQQIIQLVGISGDVWDNLTEEQQESMERNAFDVRDQNAKCMEETNAEIIEEWESSGSVTVVDDVDIEAFREIAEEHLLNHYTGEDLEYYESMIAE